MKMVSLVLGLVVLVLPLSAEDSPKTNTNTFFQQHAPSVVYIQQSVRIRPSDVPDPQLFDLLVKKMGAPLYLGDLYLPLVSGSGFFIDVNGAVVTNWHVIDGQALGNARKWSPIHWVWYIEKNFNEQEMPAEQKYRLENALAKAIDKNEVKTLVLVNNQSYFQATTVAYDIENDLALLKISLKATAALSLGPDEPPAVGTDVFSFGYPLGQDTVQSLTNLTATFTKGAVSAIRDGTLGLEHTASINPGNSGGPLLDQAGQVLGVNTANRGNSNNVYYAIPVKLVRTFLKANYQEPTAP